MTSNAISASPLMPNSSFPKIEVCEHAFQWRNLGTLSILPYDVRIKIACDIPFDPNKEDDISRCYAIMTRLIKAPLDVPKERLIFRTMDARYFTQWVRKQRVPFAELDPKKTAINDLAKLEDLIFIENDDQYINNILSWSLKPDPANFKHLTLIAQGGLAGGDDLKLIAEMTGLRTLKIKYRDISRREFCSTQLTNLEALDLQFKLHHFSSLKDLTKLRSLKIPYLANMVSDLECPTQLTTLTIRRGSKGDLTDEIVNPLQKLTNLTRLKLEGCSQLTSKGVQSLATLTKLKRLRLEGCSHLVYKSYEANINLTHNIISSLKAGQFPARAPVPDDATIV